MTTSDRGRRYTDRCRRTGGSCCAPAGDRYSQDREAFLNTDEDVSHTPGITAECALFLAEERPISGVATAIARGHGAEGLTVRTVPGLEAVTGWLERNWAMNAGGEAGPGRRAAPLVIDAKIASDGGAWWLQEAFGH